MHPCRHAGDSTGQNLAAFGHEAFEKFRIFVVHRFFREVGATARHCAVGTAKGGTAFGCFWLHDKLFDFPVQGVSTQARVVFFLFEPVGGARTLFVAFSDIARRGFSFGSGLGAFEGYDFLWHDELIF